MGNLPMHQITGSYDHLIRSVQYNRRNLDLANALVPVQAGKARGLHFFCQFVAVLAYTSSNLHFRFAAPLCVVIVL
jgi:hypothetical protein